MPTRQREVVSQAAVTPVNEGRQIELDVMRAMAILLVVAAHLRAYTSILRTPAGPFVAELGRSLFVFISGYALALNYRDIRSLQDVRRFLLKRARRIYPLYVPALFIFLVLFHYWGVWHSLDMAPVVPTIAVHLMGAQVLLSPLVAPWDLFWFIGCIVPYYFVYVALAQRGGSVKTMARTAIAVFILFAAIRVLTGFVEYRFFYYYPVFVGGVCASRAGILDRRRGIGKWTLIGVLVGMLIVIGAAALLRSIVSNELLHSNNGSLHTFLVAEAVCFVFSLAGLLLSICLSRIVVLRLPRRIAMYTTYVSVGSYAVYLFHRPLLAVLATGVHSGLRASGFLADTMVIGIGLPLVFLLGYHLQRCANGVTLLSWRERHAR